MKIKDSLHNHSKIIGMHFSPAWEPKKKHHFLIRVGNTELHLGGKEARMLHTFLNKVY